MVDCGEICVTRVIIGLKCVNMCDKAGMKGSMRKLGEFTLNFRRLLHYLLIKVQCSAIEPMARLPKMAHGNFPWHATFTAVPILFISFVGLASLCCEEYIYIYIHTYIHTYLSA